MTEPTWHVYQLRGGTELLYVGYTRRLKRRIGQHKRLKSWWPEVTGVQSEEFATEDAARRREKELWAQGRPKYNRTCPFVTHEEELARKRELDRRPEQIAKKRERTRRYTQSPEGRTVRAAYMRQFRQTRQRGAPQSGPSLFDQGGQ